MLILRVLDQSYENCKANPESCKDTIEVLLCMQAPKLPTILCVPASSPTGGTLGGYYNKPTGLPTSYYHKLHPNPEKMASVACESR